MIPGFDVGGLDDDLTRPVYGTSEADATGFEGGFAVPLRDEGAKLGEQPFAPSCAVRGAGFAAKHSFAFEGAEGELSAADIDGEPAHTSPVTRLMTSSSR